MLTAKSLLLTLLSLLSGACAGLWDLTAAELEGTLLMLAIAGFILTAAAPRRALPAVLGLAIGVLAANLLGPDLPGSHMTGLDRGLISAAVAALPAAGGAALGILVARAAARLRCR